MKAIIATHCLLGLVPLATAAIPPSMSWLPWIWALVAIHVAQLMLLSIYLALFTGQITIRLTVAALGILGIAGIQAASQLAPQTTLTSIEFLASFAQFLGMDVCITGVLAGLLVALRRPLGRVGPWTAATEPTVKSRPQYSMLAVLVLLSLSTVVMALARTTRDLHTEEDRAALLIQFLFFSVIFGANLVAAVWATLGPGPAAAKLMVVLVASAVLGVAFGMAGRFDTLGGWFLASSTLLTLIPTGIVAATLLWLRWLGYRLTRMTPVGAPHQIMESG